jgi:hypothetical protein
MKPKSDFRFFTSFYSSFQPILSAIFCKEHTVLLFHVPWYSQKGKPVKNIIYGIQLEHII